MSSRTKDILKKKELFFPTASGLNDPLDSSISITHGYEEAKKHLEITDKTPYQQKCFLLFMLNSKKFTTDRSGEEKNLNSAIQEYISATGILSLSKNPVEPLMWSHYADGHKGICIGFDSEKIGIETAFTSGDIEYINAPRYKEVFLELVEEFGEIVRPWDNHKHSDKEADAFYTKQLGKLMQSNWFVKSLKWEYEEEFRIISSKRGVCKFNPESVFEIVVGARTPKKDIDWLQSIIKKPEYSHVKLKRAAQVDGAFKFALCDITQP